MHPILSHVLLACATAFAFSPSLVSADTEPNYCAIAKGLQNASKEPLVLWQWLTSKATIFESGVPDEQSFQVEYIAYGPSLSQDADRTFVRCICDGERGQAAVVGFAAQNVPQVALCKNRLWILKRDGWYVTPNSRWGFVADRDQVTEVLANKPSRWPDESSGYILIDIGSWLSAITRDLPMECHWDSTSQTLLAVNKRGTKVSVGFRSPNDMLRYGDAIRDVHVHTSNDAHIIFQGLIHGQASPLRIESLAKLDATPLQIAGVGSEKYYQFDSVSAGNATAGMEFWDVLWPPAAEPEQVVAGVKLLHLATAGDPHDLLRSSSGDISDPEIDRRLKGIAIVLDRLDDLLTWMPAQHNAHCVDDPTLRWRLFERVVSPKPARLLAEDYLLDVLMASDLPLEWRCQFVVAIADLGASVYEARIREKLPRVTERDLMEALLFSRWQRPCEGRHVTACQNRLAKAGTNVPMATLLTETLVRMHQLEAIPQDRLSAWSEQVILKAPDAASRWKQLVMLSSFRSGQEYLQDLSERSATDDVRRDISQVLKARAAAALATGRHEEMTLDVCRRLLERK